MSDESRDISKFIRRKEKIENKLGVILGSLSAYLKQWEPGDYHVQVCGEVEADDVDVDFNIVVAVYDNQKRVVATESSPFFLDEFDGFDTFDCEIDLPKVKSISAILVYPKR